MVYVVLLIFTIIVLAITFVVQNFWVFLIITVIVVAIILIIRYSTKEQSSNKRSKCIFCNQFSLSLNNGVCKDCYSYYAKQVVTFAEETNKEFKKIDDSSISLEEKTNIFKRLEKKSDEFLNDNCGKFCSIFDKECINDLHRSLNETKEDLDRWKQKQHEHKLMLENLEKRKSAEMQTYTPVPEKYIKEEVYQSNSNRYSSKNGFQEGYSKIIGVPNNYVVFDLETTGFSQVDDEIIEIGAIRYIGNTEQARFHSYVNPHRSIPRAASAVNHITQSKVKNAPDIKDVLMDFYVFIGDLPLIAYNSDFDMNFIQWKALLALGSTIKNDVIDALPLARKYLSELPNKKLETVKQHFGLDVGSHNAIDDCIVTNHLYQYCKQFEDLKYKYVIPFAYNPQELSDLEVEYINTAVEICEKNSISKKDLTLYKNSTLLSIIKNKYDTVVSFKLYGKLQYALLLVPFDKFENECQTEIKHTASTKSEGNYTRVFTENPNQLWEFQKYIK